jgi:hypothetical protein
MADIAVPFKTREDWGSQYGDGTDVHYRLPWNEVVIHTEAGAVRDEDWLLLNNLDPSLALMLSMDEAAHMRAIEHYHSVTLGWDGVGYSFVIFPDGTICEGRGWGQQGAHTETRNATAAAFCFTGHGDLMPATPMQWAAARWLIGDGIRVGALTPNPIISGHRNYTKKGKSCPGDLIYPHIQTKLKGIYAPVEWPSTNLNVPTPIPNIEAPTMADMIVREVDTDRRAVWAIDLTTVLPGETKAGCRRWLGRRTLDAYIAFRGEKGWEPPEIPQEVIIQFPIAPGGNKPTK